MPPIALWLCFAALAQPRRFRQSQKLDASRSFSEGGAALQQVLEQGQTPMLALQRSLTAAPIGLVPRSRHCGSDLPHSRLNLPGFSDPLVQNSRYKNGTTETCSIVLSVVAYRALQCDRC